MKVVTPLFYVWCTFWYCSATQNSNPGQLERPELFIPQQLIGASSGESVTLECQFNRPASLVYSSYWMKEGRNLTLGQRHELELEIWPLSATKLSIRTVDASDFGTYKCVARNTQEEVTGVIRLYEIRRSGPLRISQHSELQRTAFTKLSEQPEVSEIFPAVPMLFTPDPNYGATVGSNINLSCSIVSQTPVTVSWLRAGHVVSDDTRHVTSQEGPFPGWGGTLLQIVNVERSDFGEYECVAKNGDKERTRKVTLQEFQQPNSVTSEGNQAALGEQCHLVADIGTCNQYVERWYFDSDWGHCRTFSYGGCGGNENRFLNKEECRAVCPHQSRSGEPTSKEIPPRVFTTSPLVVASIGSDVQLECVVEALLYKDLVASWRKDGRTVVNGRSRQSQLINDWDGTNMKLTVQLLNADDFGTYECIAMNSYGMAVARSQVLENRPTVNPETPPITPLPKFSEQQKQPEIYPVLPMVYVYDPYFGVSLASNVSMSCLVVSSSPVTAFWRRAGGSVVPVDEQHTTLQLDYNSGGNSTVLHIVNAQRSDFGEYECVAENNEGVRAGKVTLLEYQPPTQLSDAPGALGEQCHLPADIGTCSQYQEFWYYDSDWGHCRQFTYGGCGGNENRFLSKEECRAVCPHQPRNGEPQSKRIVPRVFVPTPFLEPRAGSDVLLECLVEVQQYNNTQIGWMKDGRPLINDGRRRIFGVSDFDGSNTKLMIQQIQTGDLGLYECIVMNPYGLATGKIGLFVPSESS